MAQGAPKGNNYAFFRKDHPTYSDEQIDKICQDLLKWANEEEDLHLAGFAVKYGRSEAWLFMLAENHPQLKETIPIAKRLLAKKMLNLSFYNKSVNAYTGLAYLPVYDADYKDLIKWKAEVNARASALANQSKEQQINVNILPAPKPKPKAKKLDPKKS